MDLYPAIFQRKSIRNFIPTPLDEDNLNKITEQLKNLKPLYEDIKIDFKILSTREVNQRMMKKAPHYLAVFSEVKKGYKTNVGFMMQQIDLFLSANGIGSCWQGIPSITKEVQKSTDLKFIILIAFGKAKEILYRSDISGFKRKTYPEISSNTDIPEIIEAARLAPSATNSQPWFFTGDESIIHAYMCKPGLLKKIITGRYPPIDMGIALCHLNIAAEHFEKKTTLVFDESAAKEHPHNSEYVTSLKITG